MLKIPDKQLQIGHETISIYMSFTTPDLLIKNIILDQKIYILPHTGITIPLSCKLDYVNGKCMLF